MKIPLLISFLMTMLPASPAFSQQVPPPLISVTGSAEVKVVPDEIYLSTAVETRHAQLAEAKKENDQSVAKVLAYVKSSGVEAKDVQTDFITIEPEYNREISWAKPIMYVVRQSIQIKLTDTTKFEKMLTGLLSNGVNNVSSIEFRTSQLRKHRDAARVMAIQAAREKADALVAELGVKRGKVYSIDEGDFGGVWNSFGGRGRMQQNSVQNAASYASDAEINTLSIGQISVSANVSVSFYIE